MKLGISTIYFQECSKERMLEHLETIPAQGIEVAPGMIWENPAVASGQDRLDFKSSVAQYHLNIIGLHALFYNNPNMQLFESEDSRELCRQHMVKMIKLCSDIGGGIVSFGAAHNRRRGKMPFQKAESIAVEFFKGLAAEAKDMGVFICFEPLSDAYKCDFVNTVEEGARLVEYVDHPNFRLMLDTGCMVLNNESAEDMIEKYIHLTAHVHINDPHLSPCGLMGVDHSVVDLMLRQFGYKGWLSMEFLPVSSLEEDTSYAIRCYGN